LHFSDTSVNKDRKIIDFQNIHVSSELRNNFGENNENLNEQNQKNIFLENNLGPPIDATGADLHIDEK